eukprot:scaffold6821_cov127-Cylindrotheca_fusiformis.AAC.9
MEHTTSSPRSFMLQRPHFPRSFCTDSRAAFECGKVEFTGAVSAFPDQLMSEKEDLDKYLANSMSILSVKDRETALEEVNGIASTEPEDPDTLDHCLQEFDEHLMRLKQGTYYEVAEKMDPDYVRDRDFRIMFLRANRYASNGQHGYDPKRAAWQMKNFFDTKHLLFGKDKLVKDITLDDLDEEDKHSFQRGSLQVLPVRDTAGRLILVNIGGRSHFQSIESELRAKFYMFMSLKNVEGVQEKGIVTIRYCVGQYRDEKSDPNSLSLHGKGVSSFPYHWAALHFCCDDYRQYTLLRTLFTVFPTEFAARARVHFGTHLECLYALRSYGIPEGSLPLSPTNAKLILDHHTLWYQKQRTRDIARSRNEPIIKCNEKMESDHSQISSGNFDVSFGKEIVDAPAHTPPFPQTHNDSNICYRTQQALDRFIFPRPCDVLYGNAYKLHAGNLRLREILAQHANDYEEACGRQAKIEFTAQLLRNIKATGTRFLTQDKSSMQWIEVTDSIARNRIAKSIRNRRRNWR